jgi:hypothetical protein
VGDDRRPHLYAQYYPPNDPFFGMDDLVRFRLLLSERGWVVGVVWCAQEFAGLPGSAGIAWSAATKRVEEVWSHLAECASKQVDGLAAYASLQDARGVHFHREFLPDGATRVKEWEGDGRLLEQARRWVLGVSDDKSWAGGVRLAPRTRALAQDVLPRQFQTFACRLRGEPPTESWHLLARGQVPAAGSAPRGGGL